MRSVRWPRWRCEVAERLRRQGIGVTVVDPRWVLPVPEAIVDLARDHRLVVTVEDGVRSGGVGDALAAALRAADVSTPLRDFGVAVTGTRTVAATSSWPTWA